jgi:hypothetical protein
MTLMKQSKEAVSSKPTKKADDASFNFDGEDNEEQAAEDKAILENDPDAHQYSLIEIISPTEIVEHCKFLYDFTPGTYLYVSFPYLLVMDEFCTKMFLLESKNKFKTLRLLQQFYEP